MKDRIIYDSNRAVEKASKIVLIKYIENQMTYIFDAGHSGRAVPMEY